MSVGHVEACSAAMLLCESIMADMILWTLSSVSGQPAPAILHRITHKGHTLHLTTAVCSTSPQLCAPPHHSCVLCIACVWYVTLYGNTMLPMLCACRLSSRPQQKQWSTFSPVSELHPTPPPREEPSPCTAVGPAPPLPVLLVCFLFYHIPHHPTPRPAAVHGSNGGSSSRV